MHMDKKVVQSLLIRKTQNKSDTILWLSEELLSKKLKKLGVCEGMETQELLYLFKTLKHSEEQNIYLLSSDIEDVHIFWFNNFISGNICLKELSSIYPWKHE